MNLKTSKDAKRNTLLSANFFCFSVLHFFGTAKALYNNCNQESNQDNAIVNLKTRKCNNQDNVIENFKNKKIQSRK